LQFILNAKSGLTKGASWLVGDNPVLIGRASDCDVIIEDVTVSRKHCQLRVLDNRLQLLDLGSRHPALHNGHPVRQARVGPGDELQVGKAVLFVTAAGNTRPDQSHDREAAISRKETVTIAELGLFPSEHPETPTPGWQGSHDDFEMLFRLGRALSRCTTISQALDRTSVVARDRFGDLRLAFYRYHDNSWSPYGDVPRPTEAESVRLAAVLNSGAATIHRENPSHQLEVVAPLISADTPFAICKLSVAVQALHEDHDVLLHVFAAMCDVLAPYLRTVEHMERLAAVNERLSMHEKGDPPIIGESRAISALRRRMRAAAASPMHILVTGETGTGKELVAQALHNASDRSAAPFLVVNCAALTEDLFESEMFGHVRGSFTGANAKRKGLMELADGGTLFLDEVSELSPGNQARLLRAVETGRFRAVGAEKETAANIRIIAATNVPLMEMGFREDLYHRLAGIEIHVPALRERPSDAPILAQYFLDRLAGAHPHLLRTLSQDAREAIRDYAWPGNIRQLRNAVERAAHMGSANELTAIQILELDTFPVSRIEPDHMKSIEVVEREHIARVLRICRGNMSRAARILGIHRSTLYQKAAEYGLRR
jgi:Nif-specific regulatory protein